MRGPPTSEPELIRRSRDGDEHAFGELVELHADLVYRALRRFGLTDDEADDVAQEVFLRAWRGLGRFEERSRFTTWLYRIAFNEARRRLARRGPSRAADRRAEGDEAITALPEAADLGPESRALGREFARTLGRALDELPADLRAAMVLRDIEGLSTHEAAEVVGVGEAAFKSRLHRARMRLRAVLDPYLDVR